MTREEFDTLCRDDVRRAVEENLGRDPLAVALERDPVDRKSVA